MRAMLLDEPGKPLRADNVEMPEPGPGQVLLKVHACGVCRTDLHLRDGEVEAGHLPLILGHQIVATDAHGRRVGVPWLGWTDGECHYCTSGLENLCPNGLFTGRDIDGGYAEYTVADERYCLELPDVDGRHGGRAAAVRRADRPPRAAARRRRRAPRALRLRRRPRTSSARSPCTRAGACSRSRAPTTTTRSCSP